MTAKVKSKSTFISKKKHQIIAETTKNESKVFELPQFHSKFSSPTPDPPTGAFQLTWPHPTKPLCRPELVQRKVVLKGNVQQASWKLCIKVANSRTEFVLASLGTIVVAVTIVVT